MTSNRMRRHVLLPVAILLLMISLAVVVLVNTNQRGNIHSAVSAKKQNIAGLYTLLINHETGSLLGLLDALAENHELTTPWARKDIPALLEKALPVYKKLNHDLSVTHFYFIGTDGKVDLRVHMPERRNDRIGRETFRRAKETAATSTGLEVGPLGTLTLRAVKPVVIGGELAGYMELGMEIGHIISGISENLGMDMAVLIRKEFLDEKSWQKAPPLLTKGQTMSWSRLEDYAIINLGKSTLADTLPGDLGELRKNTDSTLEVEVAGSTYIITAIPITDATGSKAGLILAFSDVTENLKSINSMTFFAAMACLMTAAVLTLLLYQRIGREETRIEKIHFDEIVDQGRIRVAEQQQYIEEISAANDTIKAQQAYLELVMETIPLPFFCKDSKGRYINVNAAFETFFGVKRDQITGKTSDDVPVLANPVNSASDEAVLSGVEKLLYETSMKCTDEANHSILVSKAGFVNPIDRSRGIVGVFLDFTGQKAAEIELEVREKHLRSIFENASIGIAVFDCAGFILSANRALSKMTGYEGEELKSMRLTDLASNGEDSAALSGRLKETTRVGKRTMEIQTRLKIKPGGYFHAFMSANWIFDSAGTPQYAVAVIHNTTEWLTAVGDRDRMTKAVEWADEAIIVTDADRRILYTNPSFTRITGYSREEAVGLTPTILKSGHHDQAFYDELTSTLQAGEVWRGRFVNKKKNGETYEESATISPVRDVDGKNLYYVAVKRDITREKELESCLRQAQKMEAVGTLASGVAHDFNNILHAITGLAQVILKSENLAKRDQEHLELLLETATRGAQLVSQILTFSRAENSEKSPLDINREINEVMKILNKAVPKNVTFDITLAADLKPINATRDQIQQIVMNMASNAWDAMPDGGVIEITTSNAVWKEEFREQFPGAPKGDYVLLKVEDGGTGMDEKTRQRIFDPFFTTKPVGKGTGLGLATVYGAVRAHDGYIHCKSEPGAGTAFSILLPALNERRKADDKAPWTGSELKGGEETILVVDDDAAILSTTSELLESFGYNVVTAATGEEALAILARKENTVGLVLLDLGMPGMGGKQCMEEINKTLPGMKIIIASGYDAAEEVTSRGAEAFLRKPFRLAELITKLRQVLDGEA